MTLHLKSKGYPFRPRLLFSSFIVVGVGFPTVYYFRRGQFLHFLGCHSVANHVSLFAKSDFCCNLRDESFFTPLLLNKLARKI